MGAAANPGSTSGVADDRDLTSDWVGQDFLNSKIELCPARFPAVLRFLEALATKHRGYCGRHNHRDHGRFRNRAKFSKWLISNIILAVYGAKKADRPSFIDGKFAGPLGPTFWKTLLWQGFNRSYRRGRSDRGWLFAAILGR
jgi:hypothetical protein